MASLKPSDITKGLLTKNPDFELKPNNDSQSPAWETFSLLCYKGDVQQGIRNLRVDLRKWIVAAVENIPTEKGLSQPSASNAGGSVRSASRSPAKKKTKVAVSDIFCGMRDQVEVDDKEGSDDNDVGIELQSYERLEVGEEDVPEVDDPLEFWKERVRHLAILGALAKRVYAIPASSSQSERDFSALKLTLIGGQGSIQKLPKLSSS